jgi:hypothetical protein
VTVRITHDGSSLDPVPLNRESPQLVRQAATGSPRMFRKLRGIRPGITPRRTTGGTCWTVRDDRHGPSGRRSGSAAPAGLSRCCRGFIALLPRRDDRDALFLQAKKASSCWTTYRGAGTDKHGERGGPGRRMMLASSDIHVGSTNRRRLGGMKALCTSGHHARIDPGVSRR